MEKEYINMQMGMLTKENGKKVNIMEKEYTDMQMGIYLKDKEKMV